jgi:hypothetical protein
MLTRRPNTIIADAAAAAGGRVLSREEIAARRAAALVADDALRPKPTVEFVGALGRLSDAFKDVREGLHAIDGKVDTLQRTLGATKSDVDMVHDRLNFGGARIEGFEQRLVELESRQAETIERMDARIGRLAQQVGVGLAVGGMLGILGVALLVVR